MDNFLATVSPHFYAVMDPFVDFVQRFSFLGEMTHVVKLHAVDAALEPVAASLGMGLTLIKYTLSLFLVYPLAWVLFVIPGKKAKHFFSFLTGFVLMQWIYGPDWIHSFISSIVTYLICALAPRNVQHKLVFVWVMGYMTASHLYRMYVSYMTGIFDFTGTQMVLTMKLTSFGYNLYDGTADFKNVFEVHDDKRKAKMYGDRKKFAITKLPNLLEFFGYIYCFTCILAGPAFEFADYQKSIDGSVFKNTSATVTNGKKGTAVAEVVPNPVLAALQRLAIGIVMIVLHLQMSARFPFSNCFNAAFVASQTHLQRYIYTVIALAGDRCKYYFVWKMAEGSSIMGGFGFQGYTAAGEPIGWGGVENIEILGFETAPNVATLSRVWNKRTQGWLERYTYQRTNRSLVITYFISAIWHGLYPGFFVFFMSLPLLTNIERLIKAKLNPIFCPGYDGYNDLTYPNTVVAKGWWLVCVVCNMAVVYYYVQTFAMGSMANVHTALGSYNYVPNIAMFVIYFLLELFPSPKKTKKE